MMIFQGFLCLSQEFQVRCKGRNYWAEKNARQAMDTIWIQTHKQGLHVHASL